jgi:ABC-type cobalamin/Fe3+-siderophores transport system ATPase subunit
MTETEPRAIIIAGPNGAGKTTFAREFLPIEAQCPVFVNADLIAAGLSPFAPEVAAIQQRGQVLPFAYFTPDLWSRAQSFSSCFCNLRKCHRPIWHVNTQRR